MIPDFLGGRMASYFSTTPWVLAASIWSPGMSFARASPRHGETGEKDISVILVGDDLR